MGRGQVGLHRDQNHRYSFNGDPKVPGVTTIIGQKAKGPGFENWLKREGVRLALSEWQEVGRLLKMGSEEGVIAFLASAADRIRDTSAKRGQDIHLAMELISSGATPDIPDEISEEVEAFRSLTVDWEFLAAEFMVYSETHGYGGTADALVRIDGKVWLIDYKTGRVYPEVALQLAGLRYADGIGRPDDPKLYPIPKIDLCGVVQVKAGGATLQEVAVTPAEFETFLALKKVWDFDRHRSKEVLGSIRT